MTVEDVVFAEPVRGHRYWHLDIPAMRLNGMAGHAWDTGMLEAVCTTFPHESPRWPEPENETSRLLTALAGASEGQCLCGVNAYKLTHPIDATYGQQFNDDGEMVHGIVDLGGRVHEYDRGYRAQYGLIIEATILTRIPYGTNFTNYLADKYECPVRVLSPADWKTEWEATYGRDRETETENTDTKTSTGTPSNPNPFGVSVTGTNFPPQGSGPGSVSVSGPRRGGGLDLTKPKLTAEAHAVTNSLGKTRYQPALSDGSRLWYYGILKPEWLEGPHRSSKIHKRVLYRTAKRAIRHARKMINKDGRDYS